MLAEAYLGLGSNMGDRSINISRGLKALRDVSRGTRVSSIYESTAAGFSDQPAFLNAACRIWTRLDPFELLHEVQRVQKSASGERPFANGPRALDIDILLFGRAVIDIPGLAVPHPRMLVREFVLAPLAEIAPGLTHPVTGEAIGSALHRLGRGSLRRVGMAPASPSYQIVDYNPAWPVAFQEEMRLIISSGVANESSVSHIGSTAVPGLAAKPTVDIMVGVPAAGGYDTPIEILRGFGYEHRGETVPGTAFLRKGEPRRFNLHLTELGGEFWGDHLLFRNYLRANRDVAMEYERLKRELMARYASSPRSYNDGKAAFILSVLTRACRGT